MRKMMALALLAATALPALASAQDWRGGDRHSGRGEQRAPMAQAPAPQQPQPQPQFQRGGLDGGRRFDRAPRPEGIPQQAPAFQRPEMRDGGRRFDRGQGFNGGQAFQNRPQENRFSGDPRRFEGGRGFVGQPQSPFQNRQAYESPRRAYQPAPTYRTDRSNPFRYDGGRAGYGSGYRPDYNRGGEQWNRGWRNDRRYDWNGYRRGHDELFRLPRYAAPYGWRYGYQRFGVGFVLEEGLFARDYWLDDPYEYRLPPVDGPYRWVRYYGDALLVDIYSGEVVDTVYGIFG